MVSSQRPRNPHSRLAQRLAYAAAAACGVYLSGCGYTGDFRLAVKTPTIDVEIGGASGGVPAARAAIDAGGISLATGGDRSATLPADASLQVQPAVK